MEVIVAVTGVPSLSSVSGFFTTVGTIYEGTSNILLNTIAKHIRHDYGG